MNISMLERKINRENSYKLKPVSELKKGDKIPLVSDTMFHVMINNSSKKKYSAYLISLVLGLEYKEVYSSLIFVNNKLDREKYKDSSKIDVSEFQNKAYFVVVDNNGRLEISQMQPITWK